MSQKLSAIKHSRHLQYSFKMALGVSLLALPAFLPPDSAGKLSPLYVERKRTQCYFRQEMVHRNPWTMGQSGLHALVMRLQLTASSASDRL
jgi:hypothetical protein